MALRTKNLDGAVGLLEKSDDLLTNCPGLCDAVEVQLTNLDVPEDKKRAEEIFLEGNKLWGDTKRAAEKYREAAALCPEHWGPPFNLATMLYRQGDLDGAEEALRTAARLTDHGDLPYTLGTLLVEKGKYEEGIKKLQEAARLLSKQDPKNSRAYHNLGYALHIQGKHREAINAYKKAIKISPHWGWIHLDLGIVLQNTGDIRGAIKCYRKAASDVGGIAYAKLGGALIQCSEVPEGCEHLLKALELGVDEATASHIMNMLDAINTL